MSLVLSLCLLTKRIWYPTSSPSSAFRSSATRWARVIAATRRGWVHTTTLSAGINPGSSQINCGIKVDLPQPVSPEIIVTTLFRIAWRMSCLFPYVGRVRENSDTESVTPGESGGFGFPSLPPVGDDSFGGFASFGEAGTMSLMASGSCCPAAACPYTSQRASIVPRKFMTFKGFSRGWFDSQSHNSLQGAETPRATLSGAPLIKVLSWVTTLLIY
mmetsp:Transcript_78138/g.178818  ORF Transcript_78138/g.178818 Transcript_78138/m.178818 type:complete len:216 (+) Transcript_78138:2257-2904(+)